MTFRPRYDPIIPTGDLFRCVSSKKGVDAMSTTAVERKWGFAFGVDGLMNLEEARQHLGNMSRKTVDRLAEACHIRRGKVGARVVFCRRSVVEYVKTVET